MLKEKKKKKQHGSWWLSPSDRQYFSSFCISLKQTVKPGLTWRLSLMACRHGENCVWPCSVCLHTVLVCFCIFVTWFKISHWETNTTPVQSRKCVYSRAWFISVVEIQSKKAFVRCRKLSISWAENSIRSNFCAIITLPTFSLSKWHKKIKA